MKQLFRKKSVTQILEDVKHHELEHATDLRKNLNLTDLVSFGIAAIIGAGIFSTIGTAAYNGGPAVIFLFIFTAIACLFSALCYAEFASTVPISGSAYTYAYTTFGELVAWILGWALVMEYGIGNITVAISWSDYFTSMMAGFGLPFPEYLSMDYLSAMRGFAEAEKQLASGKALKDLAENLQQAHAAWQNAPQIGGFHLVFDLPVLLITVAITSLVYIGIKESKTAGNIMVVVKLAVVLLVIAVGAFYVKPENWDPFAPNGMAGVLKGVSGVFFAYIGFDAISTTAEECKNPQKDMPKAMIFALILCTILYVIITLVLTGMLSYKEMNVGDPLAHVFAQNNIDFMAGIISVSAVVAITSVFLVYQLGQPRILMSMSRDGLLPKAFSKIHPKYKTPYISTIATGFLVAVPALFMNLTQVTDLASIGTLFAFTVVSGGVLLLETPPGREGTQRFRVPYYNGQFIVPGLLLTTVALVYYNYPQGIINFLTFSDLGEGFWGSLYHRIPMWIYVIFCIIISYYSFTKKLSLIPVMGLITNFYLMTELGVHNWMGFGVWLLIGLVIYFSYGYKHSKLKKIHS
ncbi:MAG: amino acid permease [Microscillaceae bacterium]|nr:amino acid permease [Microscillaceae bacterium]